MASMGAQHALILEPAFQTMPASTYQPLEPTLELTTQSWQAAKEAEIFGISVRGIKGVSVLATSLDLVNSVPVDCMHAVLEGVVRLLLHAWFDSENHREAFYLGCSGRQIDKLLLQQCPPHEFTHPPRSVLNHRNYWKASELRNWLLFYSLPILMEYLPPLYLHHYALLVCPIRILLQESLTTSQITAAESMLCDFMALLPCVLKLV